MNIVIFGGSGFIGQKIAEELVTRSYTVHCISRSGKPSNLTDSWSKNISWVQSDILTDTVWQKSVQNADWIIDTIGILFEKPHKKITYSRFIIQPIQILTNYLQQNSLPAKVIFLSANHAPFFLKKYITAKQTAETIVKQQNSKNIIFYPSFVFDQGRPFSLLSAKLIVAAKKIPGFRHFFSAYEPLSRSFLATEIANALENTSSLYMERQR